ncbi:MAG: alpha/beta hydrolase fold domain-containing protein [Turicibacter sp.]
MIEPKMVSYHEFPVSDESTAEMKVIQGEIELLNVRWIRDVEYINRESETLKLQILVPKDINDEMINRPTVVYVPGSAWHKQNVLDSVPRLTKLAEKGFVIVLVEYRPSEVAPFPAQIHDVKAAVRYIKENADVYGIDTEKVVIFGDSSGGHTSLMVGFTGEQDLTEKNDAHFKYDCSVKGVIDFYGPTDISRMNDVPSTQNHIEKSSPEGFLIGQKHVLKNLELVKPTIVMNYIAQDKVIPPTLIFHGDKDRLVPFNQSILLVEALEKYNKDITFYKVQGADHGGASFWSHSILNILEEFIYRVIK